VSTSGGVDAVEGGDPVEEVIVQGFLRAVGPTTVLGPTVGRYGVSQNVMVAAKPASIRQELRRTPGREDAGHRVDSPEAARSRRDHGQSGSDALRATVLRSVVEAVEADVAGVDADTVFVELGVDSLIAPELVATLNSALGTQLSASVLFEHSTPNQLIEQAEFFSKTPVGREMDVLLSSGERVTSALLAIALNAKGYAAIAFSGRGAGIVTDNFHTKARIVSIDPKSMQEAL